MRVAVNYTTTVDDRYRRAIRRWYGQDGLATRDEVKRWLRVYGTSMDDDLAYQEDQVERGERPEAWPERQP